MAQSAVIVDFDPAWAEAFHREAALIRAELGDLLQSIHHVGSTAIPGMAAKPVIDICVESAHFPPSDAVIAGLSRLGYAHRGAGSVAGRHWFSKGDPRGFNLHWCPIGGTVAASQVLFRAKAIARPDLAARYADAKRELSGRYDIDSLDYVLAKEPFIRAILDG